MTEMEDRKTVRLWRWKNEQIYHIMAMIECGYKPECQITDRAKRLEIDIYRSIQVKMRSLGLALTQ